MTKVLSDAGCVHKNGPRPWEPRVKEVQRNETLNRRSLRSELRRDNMKVSNQPLPIGVECMKKFH